MRLHGSVSLALLALAHPLLAQEPIIPPRPLDAFDSQPAPELNSAPQSAFPGLPSGRPPTELEIEVEALRADLRTFHVLSDEVARGVRDAESEADRTLVRQRQEMLDILTRIATQGIARKTEPAPPKPKEEPPEPVIPPTPDSAFVPHVTDRAVDHFALGKALFKAGEYARAEQAFRKVTPGADNTIMLKYLVATCLRKQSNWPAAAELYREVADSEKDPVLRDLAKFQLDGIQWTQETEKQIEQLRKQRQKPKGAGKNSP